METISPILPLVRQSKFMTKLDIKDAYCSAHACCDAYCNFTSMALFIKMLYY